MSIYKLPHDKSPCSEGNPFGRLTPDGSANGPTVDHPSQRKSLRETTRTHPGGASALRIDTRAPGPRSAPPSIERESKRKITPGRPKTPGHRKDGKPPTPLKKDLWWVDAKMKKDREQHSTQFNSRLALEDSYEKKLAKLKAQREKELIGRCFKKWKDERKFMQSGIEDAILSLSDKIPDPEVCSIAEDALLLTYDLMRARSVLDYTIAAISFAKRRTSGAIFHKALRGAIAAFVSSVITDSELFSMQSGLEDGITATRDTLKMWPRLKASPLWRKVNTVVVYATSLTLFGDATTRERALRIEENFYKSRHMMQADFVYNVLDLLLFVAERGCQVVKSKSVDPMFHSGSSYEKWYESAMDIVAKAKFLSNPQAHGIDVHTFTATLDELILKGQSMAKYACELDKAARGVIRGTVGQLLIVRATYLNKKVAQKTRKSPLALVIEGHSSVGKTTFSNVLHYYYGVTQGKNVEAGARYTRMSTAAFWDGFSSDQWSLLIDDAASIKPGVLKDIDPSIREILQVVNNAPFSPDMASLEEKGAAPFLGELVVITTNAPDLGLDHYFSTPGAVARRLPYHIRVRPKSIYKKNATMINEAVLPELEPGSYPDWWDIEILEPRLVAVSDDARFEFKQTFELFSIHRDMDMRAFLKWYHAVIVKHTDIQTRVAASEEALRCTSLCAVCKLPTGMCDCELGTDFVSPITDITFGSFSPVEVGSSPECSDVEEEMQGGVEDAKMSDILLFITDSSFLGFIQNHMWNAFLLYWYGGLSLVNLVIIPCLLSLVWAYRHVFWALVVGHEHTMVMRWMLYTWRWSYYRACDAVSRRIQPAVHTITVYSAHTAAVMRRCGDRVANTYFSMNRMCRLVVAVLTVALAAFGVYTYLRSEGKVESAMQGAVLSSVGQSPLPGTEAASVWVRDMYTPSTLDMGRHTLSWKNMPEEQAKSVLSKNCAFIRFKNKDKWQVARCTGLGGQFFLTTCHTLPEFDSYVECELVRSPVIKGPTGNVRFRLYKSEVFTDVAKDIAIFRCRCVPPTRDITGLFVKDKLTKFRANGYYLGRDTKGVVRCDAVTGIHEKPHYNTVLDSVTRVWWGECERQTENGDCGALLVAKSGQGPIILGMHQLGTRTNKIGAIKVSYEDIMALLGDQLIVSDSPPMLGAESTNLGAPGPLHPKSPVNFLDEGAVECFGSFSGFRAQPKFNVEPSIMAPYLREHGFEDKHIGPQAKGWRPKYDALTELVYLDENVNMDVLKLCVEAYTSDIMKVGQYWKDQLMVYDIHTAVNGVPGLRYVDGIKRNTSAGFPYCKPKELLLHQLEPTADYPDHVEFDNEVLERVEEMISRYQNNERAGGVFRASFKNEPLPAEKARKGKIRLFMMASVEMTIIMRMYLLSFVRVAQSNHFLFECAPGIEAQSCEWDLLHQFLTQFGEGTNVFGDFKGYDKSMHPSFVIGAFEAIASFIQQSTGDSKWANVIRCIGYDIAFAWVDYFGDLLMLFGKNPSGQALTAIINGIVGSLYMRYVYYHAVVLKNKRFAMEHFQTLVALMTYGDDNGMGVSKLIPEFNHTAIRDVLAEIGVTYTMADKESESVPFVSINEGSFLKRSWRYEPETGTMVGPLEEDSISKMLMVRIPSSVVSAEVQAVDTIRSANSEYFWHGREVFEAKHQMLLELLCDLEARGHPVLALMNPPLEDWKSLMERYVANSQEFLRSRKLPRFANLSGYKFEIPELQDGVEVALGTAPRDLCALCGTNQCQRSLTTLPVRPCVVCGRCEVYDMHHPQLHTCGFCFVDGARNVGWMTPPRRRDTWYARIVARQMLRNFEDEDEEEPTHQSGVEVPCRQCQNPLPQLIFNLWGGLCMECRTSCPYCYSSDCVRLNRRSWEYEYRLCPTCGRCEMVADEVWCFQCFDEGEPSLPMPGVEPTSAVERYRSRLLSFRVIPPTPPSPNGVEHAADRTSENPASLLRDAFAWRTRLEQLGQPKVRLRLVHRSPTEFFEDEFRFQSGVEAGATPNIGADVQAPSHATTETQQTAMFLDSGLGDTLTFAEPDSSLFTHDSQTNTDLGNFLSRPRLINTVTWTPGALSSSTFDPWTLFLNTAEIKYKLNNYAFLRGNLRVKVVLNAAPFYYGALLMYYTPLPNTLIGLSSVTGVKIQESQRPHIWLLPQNNEGGEMLLPFFYNKNFVNITQAADVDDLGTLTLKPFTDLRSANAATSNGVQMQFYAWMEDVSLFGPTVGLAMQSGDEYGNGPVSAPATAVAHWSNYLSKVPLIGRFAKATSIGASAVAQMAGLFGWSNVPVIENVKPFKNLPFHDLASAHIAEPTSKFLLDPKGELSVDPTIVGLPNVDEMSISHLVQKESYVTAGTWSAGGAAGALIFSARVTPAIGFRGTPSAAGTYTGVMTPMAWVGFPFGHWRGDIIYRFKVICSKFHSGRLRIHWDPVSNLSATTDYTHVTYTKILDLQESDEVEFRVPYMQALPWLDNDFMFGQVDPYSTTAAMTPIASVNGTLTVRVLNNLTAPVDTAVCDVLVFVRGAENLEYANPRDFNKGTTLYSMQSGTEPCPSNAPLEERYLLNWGEAIPSIRVLLRRSSLVDRITAPSITATDESGFWRTYQTRFPPSAGYDTAAYTRAQGIESPGFTFGFNYTTLTPLAWFSAGFVAMRGAIRWHYNVVNPEGKLASNITIYRRVGGNFSSGNVALESTYVSGASSTSTTQSLIKGRAWSNYSSTVGNSGTYLTNPQTQTGVSVELPMMTNYLFQYANPQNALIGTPGDGSRTDTYILEMEVHPSSGATALSKAQIHRYVSAGTDFTLHYFLNTPTVWFNTNMGNTPV